MGDAARGPEPGSSKRDEHRMVNHPIPDILLDSSHVPAAQQTLEVIADYPQRAAGTRLDHGLSVTKSWATARAESLIIPPSHFISVSPRSEDSGMQSRSSLIGVYILNNLTSQHFISLTTEPGLSGFLIYIHSAFRLDCKGYQTVKSVFTLGKISFNTLPFSRPRSKPCEHTTPEDRFY